MAAFNKNSTGTAVADALKNEIRGKYVLITGTSPRSLGEATALAIGRAKPALLILASRTPSSLEAVAARVREVVALGPATERLETKVATVVVDLVSQLSVQRAAVQIRALTPRLDVLINNAGISLRNRQISPEGIELTFATNHIGPFLLTSLLHPLLLEAQKQGIAPRVVNLSSLGHRLSPIRFSDYNFEGKAVPSEEQPPRRVPPWVLATVDGFPGTVAYGMSKCAAVLFSLSLREKYGIQSFAVDPANILTGIVREIGPEFRQQIADAPAEI